MFQPAVPGHLTHADPELNPRQRQVFARLVSLHGRTARPVGSESLAREGREPISAASVRAALADLEQAGLLERPNAASGRVPSARGYAYFVRVLLEPDALPQAVQDEVDRRLRHSAQGVEDLLSEAARLIASLTGQLGLAHAASLDHERLAGIDLEPLDGRRALMVLHLGAAAVRTLVLELESPLEREALAEVLPVLRERLVGRVLIEVRERLAADPELVRTSAAHVVVRAAMSRWSDPRPLGHFSSGVAHMAEQPEFMNAAHLAPILRVVESGQPLDRWMAASVEGQAAVQVGLDPSQPLASCSLVSFALPGALWGAVGVLGPRRMDYARVLAVVDAVGNRVSDLLQA